ncbi:IEV and EEV membrane glycoprotein [Sheeppox virus]|uniref:IEV and EEV membrane glycoprotein n=2 Tax=Sheeppox virus TaxID=10266 RepID=A0A3F2YKR9_SHEVT|nr:IEV and EEV membrane glycoprotein [Sheeppox virus]ABY47572.1 EEV glycoprotein [Sheeppox virus]AOE46485.1 EEV glycoprotein [Sheeppox virus]AOE46634.1 EEV glycoprotein [Sheeppox virus]AVI09619.1 IEV and EEV membrane glycoprotein [Sheeppox virus]QEJ80016.1 EEV glycoprotein [Sheeppox virus]
MKSLNRQTINKIKRASAPTAIFVLVLTIVSSIGTAIRYKDELFPNACNKGWVPYDDSCYLNSKLQLSLYGGVMLCNKYNAKIPNVSIRHLKVISLTYGRQFWYGLVKKKNNIWVDVNSNSTVDMNKNTELSNIKKSSKGDINACYVYNFGQFKNVSCNYVSYIICVKRLYN